jgi:hypothetical protein
VNRLIRWAVVVIAGGALGFQAFGQSTPEDLIRAVDAMSPGQAQLFAQKLQSKAWKPVPEGFFTRMSVSLSVSGDPFDEVRLKGVRQSAGEQNVEDVGGTEATVLWNVIDPRFRVGFEIGSWVAGDSALTPAGYTDVALQGGYGALVVNWQILRKPAWLLFAQVSAGGGSAQVEVTDTPAGQPTTIRRLDAAFPLAQASMGAAWRPNSVLSLFASGGYRFADQVQLEEGGEERAAEIDASGASARLGIGVNF